MSEEKPDSITFGTAATGGALKTYFDLQTMSDTEAMKLARRTKLLFDYIKEGCARLPDSKVE